MHDVILETAGLFANLKREGCHQLCLLLCLFSLVSFVSLTVQTSGFAIVSLCGFYSIAFLDLVRGSHSQALWCFELTH